MPLVLVVLFILVPVGKANEVPQSLECRVGGVRVEVEEEELCN